MTGRTVRLFRRLRQIWRRGRRGTARDRRILRQRKMQAERAVMVRLARRPSGADIDVQDLGGNCPVQGTARVTRADGVAALAYFRARGAAWSVEVWVEPVGEVDGSFGLPERAADWYHERDYGSWPDAGWMPNEEALDLFAGALERWAAGEAP